MMTKIQTKSKSRILDAVHETACDLHRLSLIGKRKMNKFDALCLDSASKGDGERTGPLREHSCGSDCVGFP